jgi:hypothetical protein
MPVPECPPSGTGIFIYIKQSLDVEAVATTSRSIGLLLIAANGAPPSRYILRWP